MYIICVLQEGVDMSVNKIQYTLFASWRYLQKGNTEGFFDVWESKWIMNELF